MVLDLAAVTGLLALGTSRGSGDAVFDTRFTTLTRRVCRLASSTLYAPAVLVDAIVAARPTRGGDRQRRQQWRAVLRGLALAAPVVAVLCLALLIGLRAVTDLPPAGGRRLYAGLAAAAVVLTLVMVHSATVRLALYDAAFGLSMLRLHSTIFAWWIGVVLVLVGLALAGVVPSRSWLPGAVGCSALALLIAVNVADPAKVVMTRNLDRVRETGKFDPSYAVALSAAPEDLGRESAV